MRTTHQPFLCRSGSERTNGSQEAGQHPRTTEKTLHTSHVRIATPTAPSHVHVRELGAQLGLAVRTNAAWAGGNLRGAAKDLNGNLRNSAAGLQDRSQESKPSVGVPDCTVNLSPLKRDMSWSSLETSHKVLRKRMPRIVWQSLWAMGSLK